MILDDAAIMPFLDAFADNGDWQAWVCIADTFADAGDDVGYQWATWVRREGRVPMRRFLFSKVAKRKRRKRRVCYKWIGHTGLAVHKTLFTNHFKRWKRCGAMNSVVNDLLEKGVNECTAKYMDGVSLSKMWLIASMPTQQLAYLALLRAWRSITEEQRAEIVGATK